MPAVLVNVDRFRTRDLHEFPEHAARDLRGETGDARPLQSCGQCPDAAVRLVHQQFEYFLPLKVCLQPLTQDCPSGSECILSSTGKVMNHSGNPLLEGYVSLNISHGYDLSDLRLPLHRDVARTRVLAGDADDLGQQRGERFVRPGPLLQFSGEILQRRFVLGIYVGCGQDRCPAGISGQGRANGLKQSPYAFPGGSSALPCELFTG